VRITIINGFFLPVPPVSGGSTEKSWHQLAREFVRQGHAVTSISRRWPEFPDEEIRDGVRHLRLRGFAHRRSLAANLLLDFLWSLRVHRTLPEADIVVCNAVALPVWLGRWRPSAGRVVLMCGRMPKGQYRRYSGIARVLAPSELVRERLVAENPALQPAIRVTGYPIDWDRLAGSAAPERAASAPVTLGFVGRIHEEKGLRLLAEALALVAADATLPAWRLRLCGPVDVARGGSGPAFKAELERRLSAGVGADRFAFVEPRFDDRALAEFYRELDVFCYPSLAAEGETFGVAVAEAMAAGAVPVVSGLACFSDFVRDGANGRVFDHTAADAAERLAAVLKVLIRDAGERRRLAAAARREAERFGFVRYAADLLADFAALARG
jgi:glycosyltransferase involved in cell wall biosynthesis